jgi:hypothetical protein
VGFPALGLVGFPALGFYFLAALQLWRARSLGDCCSLFHGLDPPPFVGRLLVRPAVAIRQPIEGRLAKARIPSAALPGDFDEAERDKFTDRRSNRVAFDTELDEMLKRAREPSIFLRLAAVMRHLDFKPGHRTVSRQSKDAVGWAFQHLD